MFHVNLKVLGFEYKVTYCDCFFFVRLMLNYNRQEKQILRKDCRMLSCCLGDQQTFDFTNKSFVSASRILNKCQEDRN